MTRSLLLSIVLSFADATQLMPFSSLVDVSLHSLLSSFNNIINNIYIALIHCWSKLYNNKNPFLATRQILYMYLALCIFPQHFIHDFNTSKRHELTPSIPKQSYSGLVQLQRPFAHLFPSKVAKVAMFS